MKTKVLLFAAAASAVFMLASCGGRKAETSVTGNVSTLTTLECDSTEVQGGVLYFLKDNSDDKMNPASLFGEVSDQIIQELGIADGIPASMGAFVLRTEGKTVLFDAGLGPKMGGGNTLRLMAEYGIAPESIDYVYITHLHADHIGGLVGDDGPVFPNAEVYLGQVEHDAWMAMSDDKNGLQKAVIGMYADRLHLFAFGDVLPCGVEAIDAVGHTPGHTVFRHENVLVIGDLLHGYALQSQYPEFCANFDMDKEKSVESRKRIFQFAADNDLMMVGMHMPATSYARRRSL